jgi:hypothetical protein
MRADKTYLYFAAILAAAVALKLWIGRNQVTEGLTASSWYFDDWFVVSIIIMLIGAPVLFGLYKLFYGIPGK